jgi:hypothetical protein
MRRSAVWDAPALATSSALALALLLTPGCAMFRGAEPEPSFEKVAVLSGGQTEVDLEADDTVKSALVGGGGGAVGGGIVGAGAGAAVGAAAGGGMLSPATAVIGAGVVGGMGAAAGATVGAVIGGLQGLPAQKAEQVTRILAGLAQTRDFQEELRSAVETALPEERRAPLDQADARATLQLTELELEQHLHDAVSVRLRARMDLQWDLELEKPHSRTTKYEYETPEQHVDAWLAENGAAFAAGFDQGIDTIARQMARDILSPPPQQQ